MRDYSTISPRFWIGHTGKKIKAMGADATIVALYLMTSPHANMLGLYYLPKYYLSHETGLTFEGASKGLQCCIEAEFCTYDEASEVVWIFEMARLQLGERLKPTDKRVIGIQNIYDKLPENPFLPTFYDKYLGLFSMQRKREADPILAVPIKAPSKGLRSQEQEQDKEQDQETDTPLSLRSSGTRAKKSEPQNRGSRLSDDFVPDETTIQSGIEVGHSREHVTGAGLEEFRDYWRSESGARARKLDWQGTYRNRLRMTAPRKPPARAGPSNGVTPVKRNPAIAIHERQRQSYDETADEPYFPNSGLVAR